jgi:uroporphyrin-III C-methyltransferase
MSKKPTDSDNVPGDAAEDANFEQLENDSSTEPTGEFVVETLVPSSPGKRVTAFVAWLALFVSLAALAAIVFEFLSDRTAAGNAARTSSELQSLTTALGGAQNTIATLEQEIAALGNLDTERGARLKSIERQLDDRLRPLEPLPGRLSVVETSMASIQGISTGARDAWLLAETEYYMQIANAQLQLANNPELARIALAHADERILQLADPRLINIRQALSDELLALEVMEKPDTAGITLTLASLAHVVDSLPLRHEAIERDETSAEIDSNLTGIDRALASLKGAVGGFVSVRRTDEAMQPLIAPEAQYFLRANLALQLQTSRLALLRGEETVFRQSLDDADAWLSEYYDPGSNGVQSTRATIAEIRGSVFSVAMPDISLSLRLLRQFNRLTQASDTDAGSVEQEQ